MFFERFGYESPQYGCICPHSMFRTSQHTHAGMMIATDDHQVLRFYDEVLGLKRWFDAERPYGAGDRLARRIFGLERGETHWMVDFDDPRSGHSLDGAPLGKLKVVRFGGVEPPAPTSATARDRAASATRTTPGAPATSKAVEAGARRAAPRR